MKSLQAIICLFSTRISFQFKRDDTIEGGYHHHSCPCPSCQRLSRVDVIVKSKFQPRSHSKVLTSWNHSFHFCYWSGVSCGKRHKRVTALRLVSHGLEGSLSPHVGNLSFLREFSLWNNSFQGTIPHELGHLSRLRRLYLGANKFSGVIPANLSWYSEHWHQSTEPGKIETNRLSQMEFMRRRLKDEKEGSPLVHAKSTKECKAMLFETGLTNQLVQFQLHRRKFRNLYLFLLQGDEALGTNKEETRKRFKINASSCEGTGHFANTCPQDDTKTTQKQEKEITAAIPSLPEPKFEGDFEGLADVLGLERSDGMNIRRCYLDYLEPLVSNYKAARSSNPTGGYGDEGIRRFEDYHGEGSRMESMAAKEKGNSHAFRINPPGRGRKILNNLGNNTTMEVFRCADNPFGGEGISRYLGLGKSLTDFILNSGAATYMEASLIPFSTSHS
ncbi:kinase-like domain-containing protein [Tanacetum coccineum]